MTLTELLIEYNDKTNLLRLYKHFELHLRAKTVNVCCTENFGFLAKKKKKRKIDDFDAHFFIRSSKIPKGVFIYFEMSIF